jgi:hypothetical protein
MVHRLVIATPCYGPPVSQYTTSIFGTSALLERNGITPIYALLEDQPHLQIARNQLAEAFLGINADEILFIDADISWSNYDLLRLIARDHDVVGAVAPYRVGLEGWPVAVIDDGPDDLKEVKLLTCQMLKIKRNVFERMEQAGLAPLRIIYAFGDDSKRETGRYRQFFAFGEDDDNCITYGEDVTFCAKWRSIGGKIYLEPNMTLGHHGKSMRTGNYAKDVLR